MNFRVPFALSFLAFSGALFAQEKPAKTERKTPAVEPSASTPKTTPSPAAATPAATPSATPKPPEKEKPTDTRAASGSSPAAITGAVPQGPAQIVHTFFGLIQQGDIDAAYFGLTRGSKIAERPEELRSLKTKTKEAVEVFGAVHGYDLVESKPVGERLVRATYLSLGHEYPLRWRFYFYKTETVWRLIDLRVDDKLSGIFEESPEVRLPDATP
ncbi:MAG TPA: hypothetical protein VGO90_09565 [Chthoniobacteraceae bacterium]|nr:hypothetical protein [Chthoniobacteraceae bacterium]